MQRLSQKLRNRKGKEEKTHVEEVAAVDEGSAAAVELSDVDLDFPLQKPTPYEVS